MSIQTQIDRISGNVSAALSAIAEKGVTVPDGSTSDALAELIESIQAGGGGGAPEKYIEETIDGRGFLTNVNIVGYTKIRRSAFYGCTNLVNVTIPGNITEIYSLAFYNCKKLALTSLPESITAIRDNAFELCSSLALTSLPESITAIAAYAFSSCSSLALTSLPESITAIENYTFKSCSSLALTSLPESITVIGRGAFMSCKKLAIASIPKKCNSIGDYAFGSCTGLTSITFEGTPSGIIDSIAFNGCTNIITINVPWAEGEVANAPWGAKNATINYNYTGA